MPNLGIVSGSPRMSFLSGELDMAATPLMDTVHQGRVSKGGPSPWTSGISPSWILRCRRSPQGREGFAAGASSCTASATRCRRLLTLMGVGRLPNLHIIPCEVPVAAP